MEAALAVPVLLAAGEGAGWGCWCRCPRTPRRCWRLPDYESQRARQGRGRAAQPPRRAPTCRRRRWARGAEGRAAGGRRWARVAEGRAGGRGRPHGGVRRRDGDGDREGEGDGDGRAAGASPAGPGRRLRGAPRSAERGGGARGAGWPPPRPGGQEAKPLEIIILGVE